MYEEVRNKLIILLEHGVKQSYIARELGINRSNVCRFIKHERELKLVYIEKLQIILKKYEGLL